MSNSELSMSSDLSEAEAATLYLLSVPGMRDSIIEGMDEDLEDWVQLCLDFNPKAKSSKRKKK